VAGETDFGAVLAEVMNNQTDRRPAIRIAGADGDSEIGYTIKSPATLDRVFALYGPGRNRGNITTSGAFDTSDTNYC